MLLDCHVLDVAPRVGGGLGRAKVNRVRSGFLLATLLATRDGTGVRDYIHVEDLADAHLAALACLESERPSLVLNAGYGHGYTVREVIASAERVLDEALPVRPRSPRAGDAASVIARSDRIRNTLDWQPAYDDLDEIVPTAIDWERRLAGGDVCRRRGRVHMAAAGSFGTTPRHPVKPGGTAA